MKTFNNIKKYFDYDDKLRRIVSIVTGILIVFYNLFSGILAVHIVYSEITGIVFPDLMVLLLCIIPGAISGALILKLLILIIDKVTRKAALENYTYIRVVLFGSVLIYLAILIVYIIIFLSSVITEKI